MKYVRESMKPTSWFFKKSIKLTSLYLHWPRIKREDTSYSKGMDEEAGLEI